MKVKGEKWIKLKLGKWKVMLLGLPVVPRSHHRYYIATTIPCDFNRNQSSTEVILTMHHASWQWMPHFRLYKFTRCKFLRCWHGSKKNLQVKCKMSLNPHINILCMFDPMGIHVLIASLWLWIFCVSRCVCMHTPNFSKERRYL